MKYIKKIGVALICICMIFPIFGTISQAASGNVSISGASATVGNHVTITCTVQCTSGPIGYANVILTYDQTALQWVMGTNMAQGGAGSVQYVDAGDGSVTKLSFQMTFKILKAGSFKVSTSNVTASDFGEVQYNPGNASGTITGKTTSSSSGGGTTGGGTTTGGGITQNNKDKNNKLSSLQIHPGTLSPAFSSGTTSYNVTVPNDTTEVTISATPQSSKATVTVSGGKNLKLGVNTAQVVVVAENGSSIAYTITIMCGEEEQIQIGGVNHKIDENFTDDQIPNGFSRTKITYNNRQYQGLTNTKGNLKLMSLLSGDHPVFFIYNQKTQEFYNFIQIFIADGKYIIPLPLSNKVVEFKDYETVSVVNQEKSFDTWKLNDEFSIAYVMNQDGEEVLYRYDHADGTFQRYTDVKIEDVDTSAGKSIFPNQYYMYAIIGLGSFCLILLVCMIYFIASREHRHAGRKRNVIKKQEKQKAEEEKQKLKEDKNLEKQRAIAEKEVAKKRAKTKVCKFCSAEVSTKIKVCPYCGNVIPIQIFKKWWFWLFVTLIAVVVLGGFGLKHGTSGHNGGKTESQVEENESENLPKEYKNALKKAEIYSETMHMSKKGIYDQLISEYGGKFTEEAAEYAVNTIVADWKANALEKAKSYQDTMGMSPEAIRDQLVSEHGEKFTEEEADYAIKNLK